MDGRRETRAPPVVERLVGRAAVRLGAGDASALADIIGVHDEPGGQVNTIATRPPRLRPRVEEILNIISEVCRDHLDEEYAVLCARLVGRLVRERRSSLLRGQPRIWAAGVIYTIAVNNFLFDHTQTPHIRAHELREPLVVPQATIYNKSRQIRELLGLRLQLDPQCAVAI